MYYTSGVCVCARVRARAGIAVVLLQIPLPHLALETLTWTGSL